VAAVPPLVRELRVATTAEVDPDRLRHLHIPVWCLVGDRSTDPQKAVVSTVHEALPMSTLVELPGQAHAAQVTAPHLVADALLQAGVSGHARSFAAHR
jgi:pimeloyl-ACP methyl ester carboxylesterase